MMEMMIPWARHGRCWNSRVEPVQARQPDKEELALLESPWGLVGFGSVPCGNHRRQNERMRQGELSASALARPANRVVQRLPGSKSQALPLCAGRHWASYLTLESPDSLSELKNGNTGKVTQRHYCEAHLSGCCQGS